MCINIPCINDPIKSRIKLLEIKMNKYFTIVDIKHFD